MSAPAAAERDRVLQEIRDALGPALSPGADLAGAVHTLITKATLALEQRNMYAAVVRRVHILWAEAQTRAGIVLADDLGAALYVPEEERR